MNQGNEASQDSQEFQPQFGDFFRFPELVSPRFSGCGVPFPLAIARERPLRGARSIIEIAAGFTKIKDGVPEADAVLAAMFSYTELRPEFRELAMLINLLCNRKAVSPSISTTTEE